MKAYSSKSDARLAAKVELGAQAIEGTDYYIRTHPQGGWGWKRLSHKTRAAAPEISDDP